MHELIPRRAGEVLIGVVETVGAAPGAAERRLHPQPLSGLRLLAKTLDRLGVSTQCGFASSVGGNPLSIDDERRKLARVVELAYAVWGTA